MKAYSYLRVSTTLQVEGDGFDRQRETIAAYAKAKGLALVEDGEFREEGVSGTKDLEDREALARLLAAVNGGSVKVVLVERADRLARDLIVSELILADFRKAGAAVIDASSGENLADPKADPSRVLVRQILGAIAQYDRSVTVLKLRAARQRIRRAVGRCEGVKPFGFYPEEAPALERLQSLRRKRKGSRRLTLRAIAAELNAEGVATRSGKPWAAATVYGILKRQRSSAAA